MTSDKNTNSLKKNITIRCIFFVIILGIIISFVNYQAFRKGLEKRNQIHLSDIIRFVEINIDKDDLAECVRTGKPSQKYFQLQLAINKIVKTYNVDNIYIIKPLNINPVDNSMCIINGISKSKIHDNHDKLYTLGDIFHSTFSPELIGELIWSSEHPNGIEFHQDSKLNKYGFFYTGYLPLKDSSGQVFAVLCADISISEIQNALFSHLKLILVLIIIVGSLFSYSFITWGQAYIADPIEKLEKSVTEFASISNNQTNPSQLIYNEPEIKTDNEVESLSQAITKMTSDIRTYAENIVAAENKVSDLKENVTKLNVLAHQDSLTHVKNKTAYDKYVDILNAKITGGTARFALVMIDLNHLKRINDTYGHEHGNDYITGSCSIICDIYEHSPVFRIGGDEFVVILERRDFDERDQLYQRLMESFTKEFKDESKDMWMRFSAAIGMAVFKPDTDKTAEDVFKKADKIMYDNKIAMHGGRE